MGKTTAHVGALAYCLLQLFQHPNPSMPRWLAFAKSSSGVPLCQAPRPPAPPSAPAARSGSHTRTASRPSSRAIPRTPSPPSPAGHGSSQEPRVSKIPKSFKILKYLRRSEKVVFCLFLSIFMLLSTQNCSELKYLGFSRTHPASNHIYLVILQNENLKEIDDNGDCRFFIILL